MALNTQLQANSSGGSTAGQVRTLEANEENQLLVAMGMPPYTEVTRRGDMWTVQTATPFAPIVAIPTTLAKLEVKNNHATRPFIVDRIWSWQLLGTAVVWAHTPWAQVGAPVVSAVTALVVYSSNGNTPYTSTTGSPLVTAVDQTVVAAGWQVFPGSTMNFGLAAATPGGANVGQVDGALVVPPGKALHICVSGSVATASSMHCGMAGHYGNITNE